MQQSVLNSFDHKIYLRRRHCRHTTQVVCAAALYLAIASYEALAGEPVQISMTADRWTTVLGDVKFVEHMGKPSIELKEGDYKKGIPEGVASLKDFQFGDGTIEYDVSAESGDGRFVCISSR